VGYRLVLGRFIPYNLRKSAYKKGRAEVDGASAGIMRNRLLGSAKMKEAERLIKSRKKEITDAWNNHFGG
jgi:hypothetical protein